MVWNLVSGLLRDPERVRVGLDAMIERECKALRGDPEREAKVWLDKLAEADEERRGYQRFAAKGLMTDRARWNLESFSQRREKIVEPERDKDALLDSYAGMVPEALDSLAPKERHQIYKMLRLRVIAGADTKIRATGAFSDVSICTPEAWY